jgi:hypothetical protein
MIVAPGLNRGQFRPGVKQWLLRALGGQVLNAIVRPMFSPSQTFGRKPAATCRRRHVRHPVMLAGSAMAVTRSRSVMIADVSELGARLGGRDLPSPGDELLMVVGSTDRMANVMWRSGDQCGVALDQPLAPDNIERMKQEADWAAVTGWER